MLNKAVIDLQLLRENAVNIKNKLVDGVKFNAVVKADAYGHGAPVVANALYKIASSFSVATVEEGVELRLSGIDKQILVLIPPLIQDMSTAVYYDLTIAIDSVESIKQVERECERQNKKILAHVKFNSGMNRFGVDDLGVLNEIAQQISKSKWVVLDGMFSHFANPANKKMRINAQNKFLLANNLIKGYNNNATCHISASGGFLKGFQGDMVRIGILLYGYKPFNSTAISVSPIMKVYAPNIKTRVVEAGQSVLYGNAKCFTTKRINLVRYGYADGLMRKKIKGQFNNRCMDVSAIVGDQKEWVCVMENANILAQKYNTISYEVLTKCAFRAQKIYLN